MDFKEGQKVMVTDRKHGHGFEIGSTVIIVDHDNTNSFLCANGKSYWCLGREELKAIESKTITTHENQPIQDFAKQVAKTVKEDWGSHNVEEFIEVFRREVGKDYGQ